MSKAKLVTLHPQMVLLPSSYQLPASEILRLISEDTVLQFLLNLLHSVYD